MKKTVLLFAFAAALFGGMAANAQISGRYTASSAVVPPSPLWAKGLKLQAGLAGSLYGGNYAGLGNFDLNYAFGSYFQLGAGVGLFCGYGDGDINSDVVPHAVTRVYLTSDKRYWRVFLTARGGLNVLDMGTRTVVDNKNYSEFDMSAPMTYNVQGGLGVDLRCGLTVHVGYLLSNTQTTIVQNGALKDKDVASAMGPYVEFGWIVPLGK